MKLHEATKQLVAQFSKNIVTEVRLANLIADINGYEEYPAMKMVFKDLLKAGYGQMLYDAYKKKPLLAFNKSINYTKEFVSKSNYKEDLVSYAFDSLL